MTRTDLDLHGRKLADEWHECASWKNVHLEAERRDQVLVLATKIAAGDATVACYLGARVFDRLKYMGDPFAAQNWLEALMVRAIVSSEDPAA